MTNGRVYTEAEIEAELGEVYNQPKDADDSREYREPFRKYSNKSVASCTCVFVNAQCTHFPLL
jgi:hypothetical protein